MTVTFDLLHQDSCNTMGVYRNMCLPGLVWIHQTDLEISCQKGFFFWCHVILTFDLVTPKVDRFMSLLRRPLAPICIKTGSFAVKISRSQVW